MYCSDCHGNNNASGPQGPHGSIYSKVLKGQWNSSTGAGASLDLCFSCHKYDEYANSANSAPAQSGFSCLTATGCNTAAITSFNPDNLHVGHAASTACQTCHVRLPHGWKNKALLVNEGDAADDAFESVYFDAATANLTVSTFKASGNWQRADCTGSGCHL